MKNFLVILIIILFPNLHISFMQEIKFVENINIFDNSYTLLAQNDISDEFSGKLLDSGGIQYIYNDSIFNKRFELNMFYNEKYQYFKENLKKGKTKYLFEISKYLFDTTHFTLYLGFCSGPGKMNNNMKSIFLENTVFQKNEIDIESINSEKEYLKLLEKYKKKIFYSEFTNRMQISKLEDMKLAKYKRKKKDLKYKNIPYDLNPIIDSKLLKRKEINLFHEKNPKILFYLASELYKLNELDYKFSKLEEKNFDVDENIEGLFTQILLETINFYDENDKLIENKIYTNDYHLNLLIYFAKYYKEYKWNEELQYFERES